MVPSQKLLLSKAVFEAVLQYSHRKIQEKPCLRIKRTSQQLTVSICAPRMVWPAYFAEEKSGRGIIARLRTKKFVEEMKIILQNTKKSTSQ